MLTDSKRWRQVWIVIPAYNEEARIGAVLDDVGTFGWDIVVVDDCSSDRTVEESLKRPVFVLEHGVNLGQGAALQTGIAFALSRGAEFLVTFDADGQHRPEDIPALLQAMESNSADFALGSRFLGDPRTVPVVRRMILRLGVLFTWLLYGIRLTDVHNGIRAMTRRGAEKIHLTLNRMEHATEIAEQIATSHLKYVEVPVTVRYSADTLRKGQRTFAAVKLGLKLILERMLR
jgi:glycosyltransferase involved in cell wall biosynthesis